VVLVTEKTTDLDCLQVERTSLRADLRPLESSAFHGALFRQLTRRPLHGVIASEMSSS